MHERLCSSHMSANPDADNATIKLINNHVNVWNVDIVND
jgi:hypothetical protein